MLRKLSQLSKRDLHFLLDIVNRSTMTHTDEDMRNLLLCVKQLIPAEEIVAGLACMNKQNQVFEVKRIVNVSYPPDWLSLYMNRKYYLIDPVLKTHYKHFGTQIWSETYKKHASPTEKDFIKHSQDFGLKNGVSIGASSSSSGGTLFSFAGRHTSSHNRHLAILECLLPHLHIALLRFVHQITSSDISLTVREKEVLQWTIKGKTGWEISQILHISERTVIFHVLNAMKKLKAQNRVQAATMALSFGFLEID